jgi:hypothetical protein
VTSERDRLGHEIEVIVRQFDAEYKRRAIRQLHATSFQRTELVSGSNIAIPGPLRDEVQHYDGAPHRLKT